MPAVVFRQAEVAPSAAHEPMSAVVDAANIPAAGVVIDRAAPRLPACHLAYLEPK
jgi:hypothetical protein